MKRMIGLILALALLCTGIPVGAVNAEESSIVAYPVEGGNIYFDTATGTVTDSDVTVIEAVIPEQIQGVTVTAIGLSAFADYTDKAKDLKRVVLPETVRELGKEAFYGRSSLEEINIPNAVEIIPVHCFRNCKGLKSIRLPESLKQIEAWAFQGCEGITEISLPEGVEKIESGAFESCKALREISLPESLNSVSSGILYDTAFFEDKSNWTDGGLYLDGWLLWAEDSLTVLQVQEGTVGIAGGLCAYGDLENIRLPEGLKYICNGAFTNCRKVSEVVFPESLEKLEYNVFYQGNSSLQAYFKGDAPEIGRDVFYVRLPNSLDYGISPYMCIYYMEGKEGWTSPTWNGYPTAVWEEIHEHEYTAQVTEPTCTEEGYTTCTCACGYSYTDDKLAALGHDYEEGKCVRCGATSDGTCGKNLIWCLDVSDGILTISGSGEMYDYDYHDGTPWLKYKDRVKEVRFVGEITHVGKYAFKDCDALCKVSLPEGLKSIGHGAFLDCTALETLILPEGLETIGDSAFNGSGLCEIVIPTSVTQLGEFLFVNCTSLTSLTVEAEVSSVGWQFCTGCTALTEVKLPESLVEIGRSAFARCESLREIELPEALTTIGPEAFKECESLSQVTVPETVKSIGATAFLECDKLTRVYFLGDAPEVGGNAFRTWDLITSDYGNIPGLVLYYIANKEGWTSPEWNGYPTATWIPEHEHSYDPVVTEPSCTEKGYTTYTCSVCGDSYVEGYVDATGHSYEAAVTAPTCTEQGYTTYTCAVCGDSYVEDYVEAAGHSYEAEVTAPTCTEQGYTTYTCSVCGDSYVADEIPAPGHSYDAVVTAPTCDEAGYTAYTCTVCGDSCISDNVPATGHDYSNGFCVDCGAEDPDWLPDNPFGDVEEEDYFYTPVLWAVQKGITTGTGATTFSPNDPCTRGQIVTFLWRACGSPEPTSATNPFTDVNSGDYYYKAVLWAVEEGITTGLSDAKFGPNEACTRGQVATFLWRAQGKPAATGSTPFSDVKTGDYYYEAVLWAVENDVTQGTGAGKFSPNDSCTRGQIVTFLYRAIA